MDTLEKGMRAMMDALDDDGQRASAIHSALKTQVSPPEKSATTLRTELLLKYYGLHALAGEVSP